MTQNEWATTWRRRIGQAVRDTRDGKRYTAEQVAERATALGYPLTRDTVINVELGRKKTLDICEIVILAKVLDVAPLSLLYPDLVDTPVEALPGVDNTTGGDAALAFCGYDEKGPMMALFRLHDSRAWYDFDKSQAARNSLLQGIRAANDRGWTVDE
jgi:transcriptional regulator with XRE-family HTH domain